MQNLFSEIDRRVSGRRNKDLSGNCSLTTDHFLVQNKAGSKEKKTKLHNIIFLNESKGKEVFGAALFE
jgi:hypothetical protein